MYLGLPSYWSIFVELLIGEGHSDNDFAVRHLERTSETLRSAGWKSWYLSAWSICDLWKGRKVNLLWSIIFLDHLKFWRLSSSCPQLNMFNFLLFWFSNFMLFLQISSISLLVFFQEPVAVDTIYSPIFICSRERTLSLWRSWYRKNYADGHVLRSIVSITLNLFQDFCDCWPKHLNYKGTRINSTTLFFPSLFCFQAWKLEEEKNTFSWLYAECPQPLASMNFIMKCCMINCLNLRRWYRINM